MTRTDDARAWGEFWKREGGGQQGGGCLPAAHAMIEQVQRRAWSGFAATLPKNARVLDLASGDGRVMRWLLAARRDLKLTGCDRAPELPQAPKGTKLRPGIAMEDLPFRNAQFHAVVSQFGFEYATLERAAQELSRVLVAKGHVGLLTHRRDGVILAHNLARRDQILWVLEERKVIELAKNHLGLRSAGIGGVPEGILQCIRDGAERYGAQSAAWEIPEAVRRSLLMGARDHPASVAQLLDTIAQRARNELSRIASLEQACARTADEIGLTGALEQAGLRELSREVLSVVDGRSIADFRMLEKT